MENLQQVFDQINSEILKSYAGLLTPKAQAFVRDHEKIAELVGEQGNRDIKFQLKAVQNTLTHMWSQLLLLKAQQKIYPFKTISQAGYFKRWGILCRRMNEDVDIFLKVAKGRIF